MTPVFINCTGDTFTPTKSGAIATCVWEICRAAQRDGIEPLVISRNQTAKPFPWPKKVLLEYPFPPAIRGAGKLFHFQQKLTGWGHIRQKKYARRVIEAIREQGVEAGPFLLHNDLELAVFLRTRFPKARIVHHFHNANSCSERFRRRFAHAVSAATAVSDYCGRWNADYLGMPRDAVRTIHNGVDGDVFKPAPEPPAGPPVINFVGRTDHNKAPDLVLRAAQMLAKRTKDFGLQILGARFYGWTEPDSYQSEIQGLAADLEKSGISVRLPGYIDRHGLPDELRKAHIHVVPSRWDEPCALTIFEGMASGLPTVASRTGGTAEVVSDAGLLFERDDVEQLAGHLHNLVVDPGLRAKLGRKARARAEYLTWDRTWAQFREVLEAR